MIWSLLKVAIFVVLTALVAWGAGYVVETPGEVRIAFGAREVSLEPITFIIVLLLALLAVWILLKLAGLLVAVLRFLNGDDTAISRHFDRSRERRGFDALAKGMIALAGGEGKEAMAKASKAEKLLDRPELTRLINAQAAEMAGNHARAEEYYKQLLEDDRTRFVGVRGLMRQRLEEGNTEVALKLAEKAFALKPKHEGVLDTLFMLQSESGDWAGARRTVEAKVKAKALPRDVGARRDAVLSLAEAREAEVTGDLARARLAARDANRLAPAFVPAAVTASRLKAGEGDRKGAEKILKKAWEANPHPDLAAAFAALVPDETAAERQERFRPLLKLKADHPETRMLAAELALAAEDFPGARRALGDLAQTRPTTRSLAIMAAVERGEGAEDSVVRGWLASALGASRGEQWVCGKCRHVHASWTPVCENCDAFDTLVWEEPPAGSVPDASSAAMLPIIVGAGRSVPGPETSDPAPKPAAPPPEASDAEQVEEEAPATSAPRGA
ncbi:heme biosynthesis protein HemY [Oceanicella sp. SM1341]|uniref:heme biosynthesis protein HemY n=1 Tax=Oceanicella sp. SM1341 TaxID=1548889 RepID=UPI000E54ECBA|nr:heme biosynthesis HemY N-terminal domain-containing protein [Oceanicella sp. SM1341]